MSNSSATPYSLLSPLFVWSGGWLMLLSRMHNRPHQHVAASLLVGLTQPITVQRQDRRERGRVVLVPPEATQSLTSEGPVAVMHLDPDEPAWRALAEGGLSDSLGTWLVAQLGALQNRPAPEQVAHLLAGLRASHPPRPLDPRIARCCRHLKAVETAPNLATLAGEAGLSVSRFRHLFREQLGVTLKRYLLHIKCQRALAAWRSGMSFTDLAMEAGFYDQPHLNRTLKAMFDALPARYARQLPVQVKHLDLS